MSDDRTHKKQKRIRVRTDVVADYFDLYNREVRRVLMPEFGLTEELTRSKVHVNSRVRCLEPDHFSGQVLRRDDYDDYDDDNDEEHDDSESDGDYTTDDEVEPAEDDDMGTEWTRYEKEQFFYCMSRYSIHRVDEWCQTFTNKSKYEILVYYQVLRSNLEQLKTTRYKRLLPRSRFPIAYEMSPEFIRLEEMLCEQVNDVVLHKAGSDEGSVEDNEDSIIDIEKWNARWEPLYANTHIEELRPISIEPLPIAPEAIRYLTELVKRHTRKLLWHSVLPSLESARISKAALLGRQAEKRQAEKRPLAEEDIIEIQAHPRKKHHRDYYPHEITREDVLQAVITLKQEGSTQTYPLTLGECVLDTIKKYEIETSTQGRLFHSKDIAKQSVLSNLVSSHQRHHNAEDDSALALTGELATRYYDGISYMDRKYMSRMNRLLTSTYADSELWHVTESTTASQGPPDLFVQYYSHSVPTPHENNVTEKLALQLHDTQLANAVLDNPCEVALACEESRRLDLEDLARSRKHENMLLRYLVGVSERAQPMRVITDQTRSTAVSNKLLQWFQVSP
ncbi:uncharacterized protein GVI51_M04389 [Nakaseomyces glabratus]|uniref:RNA polymerase I-specific transcription initiation factor RRN5 n=1 Tax=Candida glabrata (strain ATCC 2001 / BCRC 20586 / JCM 3761 / NBRC 0622 / NRRL Y-65 / CBS 138) TaxID=284593 RepID=Q6FJQ2_CANGA|nr:uncharacterized protein CAGL0M04477g [Nakaseomyces glabratus]KAH7593724.1 hypothetical protein J7294_04869 [Nakaseomyces glabratus]KAH7600175.1 hypothetical protein J7293_04861 [Nakaseomyces glabratus]QHS69224.1 uncharacterized protein GVI51_M04389 [Nakaseomyces glabratus]CAG62518.1 unnamed protein product [Nakaseomyces glabratus]|eukprot:XP_449542.1 uncharacterized protein CAGL0M04477g [[Candida] glabrata]